MAKRQQKSKRSNCYDPALREIIAWRIAEGRKNVFPGRGGQGRCAAEFGISPQQWSQYESGHRTPEDQTLERIAKHLKTTVQKLMTHPENWTAIREERLSARSRDKKTVKTDRQKTAVEQVRASLGSTADHVSPANKSHSADPAPNAGQHTKIMESIQKLTNIAMLHTEGKISAQDLASTLKSVDVLIDALYRDVTR